MTFISFAYKVVISVIENTDSTVELEIFHIIWLNRLPTRVAQEICDQVVLSEYAQIWTNKYILIITLLHNLKPWNTNVVPFNLHPHIHNAVFYALVRRCAGVHRCEHTHWHKTRTTAYPCMYMTPTHTHKERLQIQTTHLHPVRMLLYEYVITIIADSIGAACVSYE